MLANQLIYVPKHTNTSSVSFQLNKAQNNLIDSGEFSSFFTIHCSSTLNSMLFYTPVSKSTHMFFLFGFRIRTCTCKKINRHTRIQLSEVNEKMKN